MTRRPLPASPEEFVRRLQSLTAIWRQHGSSPAQKRMVRNLRRKEIRRYKQRTGIATLPRPFGSQSTSEQWRLGKVEDIKIVILPGAPGVNADRTPRHRMRKLLHDTLRQDGQTIVELVNAGNSDNRRLPAVASGSIGQHDALRCLYLEELGTAIFPELEDEQRAELERGGATILPNLFVSLDTPGVSSLSVDPSSSWHREKINLSAATAVGVQGKGVSIGLLDSGIDDQHPEFAGRAVLYKAFPATVIPGRQERVRDYDIHGTHVAGICAGRTIGIAPEAHLSVAAVLTERDLHGRIGGHLAQILQGLNWLAGKAGAQGEGVDIVNASLGIAELDQKQRRALYDAISGFGTLGGIIVAATGNSRKGYGHHGFPARFDHVIAVGASDIADRVADFSDWGPACAIDRDIDAHKPDLVAPGVDIHSCVPFNKYRVLSGTSMATPIVSAAAALLIEADPSLRDNAARLKERLLQLTVPLLPAAHGHLHQSGRGRLDLAKLVELGNAN